VDDPTELIPNHYTGIIRDSPLKKSFGPLEELKATDIQVFICKVGRISQLKRSILGVQQKRVFIYDEEQLKALYGPSLWTLVRHQIAL
jgi:hypothetical protein